MNKTQIVATIGPASYKKEILKEMIQKGMSLARLNFSWGTYDEYKEYIKNIRESAQEEGKKIPIIQDLSGPRIQYGKGHVFDENAIEIITEKDLNDLKFGIEENIDYVAMSFVGNAKDISNLRAKMQEYRKVIPIIAKIERKTALVNLDEIIKESDGIMIARGDLGNEIPLEEIPFVEKDIITKCNFAKKPVIVATEMMITMVDNLLPSRAEMTDVAYAVICGADAVMLSEESAKGKHPVEAIEMMEREIIESEKHSGRTEFNSFI